MSYKERQREIRAAIKLYKQTNPVKYATLVAKVKIESSLPNIKLDWIHTYNSMVVEGRTPTLAAELATYQVERNLSADLKAEVHNASIAWTHEMFERAADRDIEWKLEHTLVSTEIPKIDLSNVTGIIAMRQWHLDRGLLHSIVQTEHIWGTTTTSDRPPSEHNSAGLYCFGLNSQGLIHFGGYLSGCIGLLELRGRCVTHHVEGIVRAEWARILAILITQWDKSIYDTLPKLRENYFTVPIFIVNPDIAARYLTHTAVELEEREVSKC